MEIWVTTILQTLISGAILLFLTKSVDKSSENARSASEVEKKMVQKELATMTLKFVSMEQKHDKIIEEVQKLKERVSVLVQKSDDLQTRVFEMSHALDGLKVASTHGRVIKK